MEKGFKPITVEDFELTPEQMQILVRGSQIFAGPHQAEPPDPDEQPEEKDNADPGKP